MLVDTEIEVKWHSKNKKHFEEKGYVFTKFRDTFMVKQKDLPKGTHLRVDAICDYCEKIYYPEYREYIKGKNKPISKDCCFDCRHKKRKEVVIAEYGVENVFQLEEIQEKIKNTLVEKYGSEHIMQVEKIKEKIAKTNMGKYGVEFPLQSEEIQEKIIKSNIEKYGVKSTSQIQEIKEKQLATLYKNGNIPTSKQQIQVHDMLQNYGYKVELNYPFKQFALDIALFKDNIKIDIEYDGWYWHQDKQKDRRRDEFIKSQGWKVLRIVAEHKIPTIEQLNESIHKLLTTDRVFTCIIVDDVKNKIV